VHIVPSMDLRAGRSRLVFWPGASTGTGAPTDRPELIARQFVSLGAVMLHVVDLDGAVHGAPANIDAIAAISREVAVPLQVAGGIDGPRQIELAFAAGATRVVIPVWSVVEDTDNLRACLAAAGDWLGVGIDARYERLRDYPWRALPLTQVDVIERLAAEGVRRVIVSHWNRDNVAGLVRLATVHDLELELAGGVSGPADVDAARDSGAAALIVGEPLFNGVIDFKEVAING
jgi:phosphoribosylformimino-5-aminoimidazole carboxamide ribotide isomerase